MPVIRTFLAALFSLITFEMAEAASPPDAIVLAFEADQAEALDLDSAAAWYKGRLGFRVLVQDAHHVLLERDGRTLELRPVRAERGEASIPMQIEVDSLSLALSRPGLTVISGPVVARDPPSRRAYVRVDDGTLVEFYQRLTPWA